MQKHSETWEAQRTSILEEAWKSFKAYVRWDLFLSADLLNATWLRAHEKWESSLASAAWTVPGLTLAEPVVIDLIMSN